MTPEARSSDVLAPCPDCGELLGGRYPHDGRLVCWPCFMKRTGVDPLPAYTPRRDPEWVTFRQTIVDRLWALDSRRFFYIDENRILGACPICGGGYVRVDFHGTTPRADITCSLGCDGFEVAGALGWRR
jgi:hypothetical protein